MCNVPRVFVLFFIATYLVYHVYYFYKTSLRVSSELRVFSVPRVCAGLLALAQLHGPPRLEGYHGGVHLYQV